MSVGGRLEADIWSWTFEVPLLTVFVFGLALSSPFGLSLWWSGTVSVDVAVVTGSVHSAASVTGPVISLVLDWLTTDLRPMTSESSTSVEVLVTASSMVLSSVVALFDWKLPVSVVSVPVMTMVMSIMVAYVSTSSSVWYLVSVDVEGSWCVSVPERLLAVHASDASVRDSRPVSVVIVVVSVPLVWFGSCAVCGSSVGSVVSVVIGSLGVVLGDTVSCNAGTSGHVASPLVVVSVSGCVPWRVCLEILI